MNLIEVFALLSLTALAVSICFCVRHNRIKAVRAERMMRCLESAIRREVTLLAAM
jgi:hypothetical protein